VLVFKDEIYLILDLAIVIIEVTTFEAGSELFGNPA
jgi:hypothetical protein